MKLYDFRFSSAAMRLHIALHILQLDYQSIPVNLAQKEQNSDWYLALNPQGKLPLLEVDGQYLSQSLAVLEYLNEVYAAGWLPKDPLARAQIRALAYIIAIDTHPLCNLSVAEFAENQSQAKITKNQWLSHFMLAGFHRFEEMLKRHAPAETQITLADICLMPQVISAQRLNISLAPFPITMKRVQSLAHHPSFMNLDKSL